MKPTCNTDELSHPADCLDYFQQMILNGLRYWEEHAAIQTIDVPVLDRELDGILSALQRGMEYDLAWPLARKLIETLASYMERRGYWTEWRVVLDQSIETSQRVGDVAGETTMTALLARLSQRQSRGKDVVRYYRRVMRLAKQSDNQYEFARACCNLGYYYIDASRWWRSEVLSLRALEVFEELGSDHGRAYTHNHLGVLYTRQQDWPHAESHLNLACHIWQANQDEHNLMYGLLNLGLLYNEQFLPNQAINPLKRAVSISEVIGEKFLISNILNNLAIAYRYCEQYKEAEATALKAEKIAQNHSLNLELAQISHNLGLLYAKVGRTIESNQYLSNALKMYQKIEHQTGVGWVADDIRILNKS